jgi:hypothetical protein
MKTVETSKFCEFSHGSIIILAQYFYHVKY